LYELIAFMAHQQLW